MALAQAPEYIGTEEVNDANRAMITFLGINDTEAILDHADEIESGVLPKIPYGHTTVPSLFDPIQAPAGLHTGRWESLVPFEADWDNIKDDYTRLCIETWQDYAPNLEPLNTFVCPPTYFEQKFKNMVKGSIKQGSYKTLQMGTFRPNEYCSEYTTPIKDLYVCGSSTYPGGTILMAGGYNAANRIAEDYGIEKWWKKPESVVRAEELGLL